MITWNGEILSNSSGNVNVLCLKSLKAIRNDNVFNQEPEAPKERRSETGDSYL
jgi:hypothetical protein